MTNLGFVLIFGVGKGPLAGQGFVICDVESLGQLPATLKSRERCWVKCGRAFF